MADHITEESDGMRLDGTGLIYRDGILYREGDNTDTAVNDRLKRMARNAAAMNAEGHLEPLGEGDNDRPIDSMGHDFVPYVDDSNGGGPECQKCHAAKWMHHAPLGEGDSP